MKTNPAVLRALSDAAARPRVLRSQVPDAENHPADGARKPCLRLGSMSNVAATIAQIGARPRHAWRAYGAPPYFLSMALVLPSRRICSSVAFRRAINALGTPRLQAR